MINQLRKYQSTGQPIELIYLDRNGKTSQRMVRILKISGDRVKAYCLTKRGPRLFVIESILAVQPVVKRQAAGY